MAVNPMSDLGKLHRQQMEELMDVVKSTLTERGARYGTFMDNAMIGQKLKEVVRKNPNWNHLAFDQKQMIDVIFDKVSRIITGDPDYTDNYLDIEGYARLVRERIEGNKDVHRCADYTEILGTTRLKNKDGEPA